jgi:hypothetical protein
MAKAHIFRKHKRKFTTEQLPKGRESRESHAEFLTLNWRLLAAAAWDGYQRQGRGAIVIDSMHATDAPSGLPWQVGRADSAYVALADLERTGIAQEEEKRLIARYDPEREIVAIILRSDGGVSGYRMGTAHDLKPPEALAHYGGRLPTGQPKPGPQG